MKNPISFSTPMVKAIDNGIKTQTRRIQKTDRDVLKRFGIKGDLLWVREAYYWDANGLKYKALCSEKYLDFFSVTGKMWCPPNYMAEDEARIWIKIINTRLERLQDITDADIKAEGFITRELLKSYWDELHKKPEEKWDANPDVLVIEFQKYEPEGQRCAA